MDPDQVKGRIDQACRVAEEFTKIYYETTDKRRHLVSKLYLETGLLSWNGNGVKGSDRIQKFLIELPASDHTLVTLDAQPILDAAVSGQLTFLIQTSGTVKYQDKTPKTFQQNFVITAQGDKWKIVSDCFRIQEPLINSRIPKRNSKFTSTQQWRPTINEIGSGSVLYIMLSHT